MSTEVLASPSPIQTTTSTTPEPSELFLSLLNNNAVWDQIASLEMSLIKESEYYLSVEITLKVPRAVRLRMVMESIEDWLDRVCYQVEASHSHTNSLQLPGLLSQWRKQSLLEVQKQLANPFFFKEVAPGRIISQVHPKRPFSVDLRGVVMDRAIFSQIYEPHSTEYAIAYAFWLCEMARQHLISQWKEYAHGN